MVFINLLYSNLIGQNVTTIVQIHTCMYILYQIYIPVISQSDYRIFAATYMYMYDLIIGTVFIQSKAHHS